MLDNDLAELYGVETKRLTEAVKRNLDRFPDDFMFQLDAAEFATLRSQSATSNEEDPAQDQNLRSQSATSSGRGGRRHQPYVFTEHGVAMLSSVLRSKRAVAVNIEIVRAFARKIDALEGHLGTHDAQIAQIIDAIRQLMEPPPPKPKRQIGFAPPKE